MILHASSFFTADQLDGGMVPAAAFNEVTTTDWAIGFEDLRLAQSYQDYNDLVVNIGSIQGVNTLGPQAPEPSLFLKLGKAIVCCPSFLRRDAPEFSRRARVPL